MKNKLLTFVLSLIVAFTLSIEASAAITPGAKCSKAGVKQVYKGKTYTCIKLGKFLYWNNGVKVKTPSQEPTFPALPKPTSSPSPVVTISSELPVAGKTYFGQAFNFSEQCWFAKKYSNNSLLVSKAAEQSSQVISPEGTIMFNIRFDVPSMKPKSEIWVTSWLLNPYGCGKGIGRTIDSPVEDRNFKYYSSGYTRHLITPAKELPTILSIIKEEGINAKTFIYKLKIQNNSIDRTLVDSNQSRIGFVFLNASGEPLHALTGRIRAAVPPGGLATLTAGDELYYPGYEVPGYSKIEPSLVFELCKGKDCTY